MAERLFIFVQMEFPWALGPPDGRYLVRTHAGAEPDHVLVLGTVGAGRASERTVHAGGSRAPLLPRRRARGGARPATPEPAPVPTTRVTVIDPVPLAAEQQARAWLAGLDRERDVRASTAAINRLLYVHRIAAADPHVHEVSPDQALVIRAGWGAGEQVADGRWLHARELPWSPRGETASRWRRRAAERSSALRPVERLTALLGGRDRSLICEELALRARLDLDEGRLGHAALELEHAYLMAVAELRAEGRADLSARVEELERLSTGVAEQARAALPAGTAGHSAAPDKELLAHALGRLEAALRARSLRSSLR